MSKGFTGRSSTSKIDSYATLGLNGVSNSNSYRVHEIEKHFHSIERWFGSDGDGSGSVANNLTEWTMTAGTSQSFGTEVQLLGANDINQTDFGFIPVKFDLHRMLITESSANDVNYIIQFWSGTGTFGESNLITEVPYRTGGNAAEVSPIDMQMSRQNVANKIWSRIKCETNSATLALIVGAHSYIG